MDKDNSKSGSLAGRVRAFFSKEKKYTAKDIGRFGESYTARYMRLHGYKIRERNFVMFGAEIDIIAEKGKYIVFVEVKTRSAETDSDKYGRAQDAVDSAKRRRIAKAAAHYIATHGCTKQPRCDIAEVYVVNRKRGLRATEFFYSEAAF